ncbi:small nuclear ribonucleoprotein E isoform X2 [Heteronotia binoei]|uniref:small nuclear ribonucleoprotein E isoform X2 n=1 Tax=Heteronotia binoei TaxID=13085 RepID=UPI002931EBA1|nr:small nuclear ribonucleoprotein E isoform X2 [Heteronotia binoei]
MHTHRRHVECLSPCKTTDRPFTSIPFRRYPELLLLNYLKRYKVLKYVVSTASAVETGILETSSLFFALSHLSQNLIFRYLQNRSRIQVWLYEQVNMRIEGCIIGFDEYMNLVLDDAEEIHSKTKSRKQLGRIMLKGDNITLLQSVSN